MDFFAARALLDFLAGLVFLLRVGAFFFLPGFVTDLRALVFLVTFLAAFFRVEAFCLRTGLALAAASRRGAGNCTAWPYSP